MECSVHGYELHVTYVLGESGERLESYLGDERRPEDCGKVIYECIRCQIVGGLINSV